MKKIETEKLSAINGGWARWGDWNLPVGDYNRNCERKYTGSYTVYSPWGTKIGKVAYIVYYDYAKRRTFRTA